MKKRNKDTIRSIEYICFIFLSTLLVFHPTIRFVRHNYIFLNVFPTRRFCLKLLVAFPSNQYLPPTIFWPFLLLSFVFFFKAFFWKLHCFYRVFFYSQHLSYAGELVSSFSFLPWTPQLLLLLLWRSTGHCNIANVNRVYVIGAAREGQRW